MHRQILVYRVLHQLHWLPVEYRIKYKLRVLMHHIHRRQCPHYLGDIVQLAATATSRPALQSANSDMYKMPIAKVGEPV